VLHQRRDVFVEIGAGLAAGSASLQADALDFLGDAANYAISLFVVGMALRYRAMAALGKAATMGVFGLWVMGVTVWHALHGTLPQAFTMGAVGFAALVANAASFGFLWVYRAGDSNMRSAWICTRNDVLGNVRCCSLRRVSFGTGTSCPDLASRGGHSRPLYKALGSSCAMQRRPSLTNSVHHRGGRYVNAARVRAQQWGYHWRSDAPRQVLHHGCLWRSFPWNRGGVTMPVRGGGGCSIVVRHKAGKGTGHGAR
jgi:hypothetical protein